MKKLTHADSFMAEDSYDLGIWQNLMLEIFQSTRAFCGGEGSCC